MFKFVGDHQVLKVTLFFLTLALIFHIFLLDIEKCQIKKNLLSAKFILPFLNLLALGSGLLIFKNEKLILKIIFVSLVALLLLTSLTYNLINMSECSPLIFSLFLASFILPYALMIFW